jgi:hypothetical protein
MGWFGEQCRPRVRVGARSLSVVHETGSTATLQRSRTGGTSSWTGAASEGRDIQAHRHGGHAASAAQRQRHLCPHPLKRARRELVSTKARSVVRAGRASHARSDRESATEPCIRASRRGRRQRPVERKSRHSKSRANPKAHWPVGADHGWAVGNDRPHPGEGAGATARRSPGVRQGLRLRDVQPDERAVRHLGRVNGTARPPRAERMKRGSTRQTARDALRSSARCGSSRTTQLAHGRPGIRPALASTFRR